MFVSLLVVIALPQSVVVYFSLMSIFYTYMGTPRWKCQPLKNMVRCCDRSFNHLYLLNRSIFVLCVCVLVYLLPSNRLSVFYSVPVRDYRARSTTWGDRGFQHLFLYIFPKGLSHLFTYCTV
ncbi:hypothetical protein, unlikely [Trypanosoma brucei gambiense DAL972]|uniref:Uncharacterized protein n=1 Tax=Trypanosoma brucei gambiense (strain MHOM/CI/86/DAL972) TaxID=679716 RepID=C9ZPM7_TRYB9|nr:hypothetical protein, unlikely [Trypanosoma brucei gambiense DAL972]CBH11355.1 hypothetical protein, unlikely [Trypanosoma brucei gambiense DAL972]|eukprot:XP_011773642.1 hypothetical protein, unlikely [Trypanosoma brucei gambiense DAL972]